MGTDITITKIMTAAWFELLQLNDATFPIGSYSFSWGLETFVQQGIIHDEGSTARYIESELESSFLYSELLTVRLAWEYSVFPQKLADLNEIYGASRSPFELRDGSRKLGARFVKTTSSFTEQMQSEEKSASEPLFFPVAYGVYCARRKLPLEDSLSSFLYSQTSARITTCVKLVPLSQTTGQQLLFKLIQKFPLLIQKCMELSKDDLCRSAPGIDIRAMQHEFLYSRLYSN